MPRRPKPRQQETATPRRSRRVWAGLLGLTLAAGLGGAWLAFGRVTIKRDPGLSVLLITIDTLRADALGCYGHPTVATPWIDGLAASGVRFTRAHAQNVVTLPSHANILAGLLPLAHGVRDNAGFRFPAGVPTLATILKQRGYHTGAFVSAFPLDSRFGLTRGFDVYDDRLADAEGRVALRMQERRGRDTVIAAMRWLDAQAGARSFLWVHVYDPHFPYEPREPFASRHAGDPYHGEVSAADEALRPLLEPLIGAGARSRSLVVLTADHGEALGEHEEMTHGIFAYEGTLRVPLLLHQPGLLRPRVVDDAVRHVDILPTVLDALALEPPAGLPGRSLLPLASGGGDPPPQTSYFEALSGMLNRGWAPLRGVIHERFKYVDLPIPELYDLAADPGEQRNLAATEPKQLERLRELLASLRRAERSLAREQESAATRERLQALGYVSAAAPQPKERYAAEDDPKRLIGLDRLLQDALDRYSRGDLAGAQAQCEELARRRPEMALAWQQLGSIRRARGDLGGAIAALKKAIAVKPDDADTAALLGIYLNEAGSPREAESFLAPYAQRLDPDLDVLIAHGMALAALGRPQQALASFERVRALDASNALALVNVGTVHLMAGARQRAAQAFVEALELDPNVARAHNSLGVIAAEEGRTDDALRHWHEGVRLDPHDPQTLFNLGTLLLRLGRPKEARHFLEGYLREAPPGSEVSDRERVRQVLKTLD